MQKWILVFISFVFSAQPVSAFTIAQKGRVDGPAIHSTYFLTPNNESFTVQASAMMGTWLNGTCVYATQINIGQDFLRSGDFVDVDAYQLKAVAGNGYSCMTITYYYKQPVRETIQLGWDGLNYTDSLPSTSEVTIL